VKTSWETSWEINWETRERRPREGGHTIQQRETRRGDKLGDKQGDKLGDKLGDKGDKASGMWTHHPPKGKLGEGRQSLGKADTPSNSGRSPCKRAPPQPLGVCLFHGSHDWSVLISNNPLA